MAQRTTSASPRPLVDSILQSSFLSSNSSTATIKKIELAWTRITPDVCKSMCRSILEHGSNDALEVNLMDNQLGPEMAQKIVSALESVPVKEVLLRYNDIGQEGCRALARLVDISATLQLLDIRGNGLGAKQIQPLFKSIATSTTLTQLGLSANKIGPRGAALIFNALEKNTYVRSIDLSLNEIGSFGAESIARLLALPASTLQNVDLYGNQLGCAGIVEIMKVMRRNTSLRVLLLGNNNATDDVVVHVADMLRDNTYLDSLDLRFNTITATGAKHLAHEGLAHNSTLFSLSLSGNPIQCVGADEIAKALLPNSANRLAKLDLSSCELGPAGGLHVASLIRASITLREVNLSDNKLDDEAAIALSRGIINSVTISALDLSSNEIGEIGASNLVDATQKNPRMASLILTGNDIDRVVQKKIDALLHERVFRNRVMSRRAFFKS